MCCAVYVVCCDCGVRVSVGVCTCLRTCMHMWREADVACFLYSLVLCLFLSQDLPMNLLIGSALLTGASGIHLTLPRSKQVQRSEDQSACLHHTQVFSCVLGVLKLKEQALYQVEPHPTPPHPKHIFRVISGKQEPHQELGCGGAFPSPLTKV